MEELFKNPQYYRNIILRNLTNDLVKEELKGKGIACVFLTRFCPVPCNFCFLNPYLITRQKLKNWRNFV